jgi:hypothetical protein
VGLTTTRPAPDLDEVARIGAVSNRVIRNLEITECYASLLALGRDLDAPVPAVLAHPQSPDLMAFVAEFDPCPPGGIACGATDWSDLRQRMHYILHLFRAYAVDEVLFSAPFTPRQVEQFRARRIPDGEL